MGHTQPKSSGYLTRLELTFLQGWPLDYIDSTKTISNDIAEVYKTLGIEAARQTIYDEITDVMEFDGAYINSHHLTVLV